jgi:broad specificity phosphatase PhoE
VKVLHLVRHGRTASNARGLLLGRADPPIDPAGIEQAAALASFVGPVARVVSSPLQRCMATAAVIADAAGVEVEVDERWIELDYGELDGRPITDVPAATWAAWRADIDWRPPGGETLAELGERVRAACAALAADAGDGGGDVVVVSHVSPIKAAVAWALGAGDELTWRMHVSPGSISRVTVTPERPPLLNAFNIVP